MTTAPELQISITAEDMNQVITENPIVGMQLRVAALSRTLEAQQTRILELEAALADKSDEPEVIPKQKKG